MLHELARKLNSAESLVLSTHRNCDGDGLGAQLALFHGLRKIGKKVRILNVDQPGRKYDFLGARNWIEEFNGKQEPLGPTDLALILDTNDHRLVEPLFAEFNHKCREILFIDHHPVLARGPKPTLGSWIDTSAASTGELCYRILKVLLGEKNIAFDAGIARALYTSVVFDTQLFRYVRSASHSHLMAADLLKYELNPEEVHRRLFATYTVPKMKFLTDALSRVEYSRESQIAFVYLDRELLGALPPDDSGDVIDMIMNIETIEAAALLREDSPGVFKLSLRSNGGLRVLPIAESFGGGGHKNAAGAYIRIDASSEPRFLRDEIKLRLEKALDQLREGIGS